MESPALSVPAAASRVLTVAPPLIVSEAEVRVKVLVSRTTVPSTVTVIGASASE